MTIPVCTEEMAKPKGVCDARCQSFYNEVLRKENILRMKWFLKNQHRLIQNLGKEEDVDKKLSSKYIACQPEKEAATSIGKRSLMPHWRPRTSNDSIDINIMKPVHPDIRATLFEKGVHSSIAATNYNRQRLKESPENRYYYPECTNWMYGWRLTDFSPVSRVNFGLKSVIQTEFYHPKACNIHREPAWYREQPTRNVKDLNI